MPFVLVNSVSIVSIIHIRNVIFILLLVISYKSQDLCQQFVNNIDKNVIQILLIFMLNN